MDEQRKQSVAGQHRPHVFGMLAGCGERHGRQNDAAGCAGKACAVREQDDEVEVGRHHQAVEAQVDPDQAQIILAQEVCLVAGVGQNLPVSAEGLAVFVPADGQAQQEDEHIKDRAEELIGIAVCGIHGVVGGDGLRHLHAHGFIEEGEDKQTEQARRQSAVIQVEAAVQLGGAGQQRRHGHAKEDAQENTGENGKQIDLPAAQRHRQIDRERIPKQQLADKRPEGGDEHCPVQVFAETQPMQTAMEPEAGHQRQHIHQIQAVKAMGDDQKVSRPHIRAELDAAQPCEQRAEAAADRRIQEGRRQAGNPEIICDQRARLYLQAQPRRHHLAGRFPEIDGCRGGRQQQTQRKQQAHPADDLIDFVLQIIHGAQLLQAK